MHPLQSVPVEEEWCAVLLRPTPDVRFDLKGLYALALRGCWNAILEGQDEILHGSLDDHAAKRAFLTLAAFKTKNYKAAAEEFDKLEVPISNCSFGVQLLYALLPFFDGHSRTTIDRLTLLLESQNTKDRRYEMVTWCMINIYMKDKNPLEALKHLNHLLSLHSDHQKAWFAVCCILLALGDIETAKYMREKIYEADLGNLIDGLCSFSSMDYNDAVSCFGRVAEESAFHVIAVNNGAICELCRQDSQTAIHTLQRNLNDQPLRHIEEPLVRSLRQMYDLRGGFLGDEYIEKLQQWITELIPDDFDQTALEAGSSS